ncbi:hypothetical protein GGE68_000315 [Rhizobium leguminosarum]|nr:hypothetical protein [Rhizobium leguminosarum]MBB5662148.1 hypothetical protein [Rhizobium leguminosarum]
MKLTVLAAAVVLTVPFALPAGAQVVIHEDQGPAYSPDYPDDDQVETDFLRRWNSHHDSRSWGSRSANFGPDDAMRLLERRGYRVRDVKDVGERYLIRASRDGDDLLVSVSRRGENYGCRSRAILIGVLRCAAGRMPDARWRRKETGPTEAGLRIRFSLQEWCNYRYISLPRERSSHWVSALSGKLMHHIKIISIKLKSSAVRAGWVTQS